MGSPEDSERISRKKLESKFRKLLTAAQHTHLGKHKAEVAVTTRLKSAFIRKKSNEIETKKKTRKKNRSQTV